MLEKVQKILDRCEELHRLLGDPGVLADQKLVRDLGKELSTLEPIAKVGRVYIKAVRELAGSREVMDTSQDPDMKSLAFEEYSSLKERVGRMEEDLKLLMVPQDPNDEPASVLLERIRVAQPDSARRRSKSRRRRPTPAT